MASILVNSSAKALSAVNLRPLQAPLLNKNLVASAWVGSYRIRNPDEFLDQFPKPKRWPRYNEEIKEPQMDPTEDRRPATFHWYRENIKSSPKRMWYVCKHIRGKNVDEAIKDLSCFLDKSCQIMVQCLKEAQEEAVRNHNFEFKSNMWVEDSKATKGLCIKGLRKHARMRFGTITYFYVHVLLKLTEGEPPKHFYRPEKDGNDLLKDYFDDLRSRKIAQGN